MVFYHGELCIIYSQFCLADSIGGVVTVLKVEGKASYKYDLRHNIQSFSYGSWSKSSVIFQREY